MIRCKNCSFINEGVDTKCKICGESLTPTESECAELITTAKFLEKKKNYTEAVEIYRFLANLGITDGEREYASILEGGVLVPKNYELAMEYFHRAAKKNDAYAAYRYSLLAERECDRSSEFWLLFAAFLGARESFVKAAELYSSRGDEVTASYYYSLASDSGDRDSTIIMANRYYEGVGVERDEQYAKWYIEKFAFPPLYAIKLAFKLRSVVSAVPPNPIFTTYKKVLRSLKSQAKKYNIDTAYFRLCSQDAEDETADSLRSLGILYVEGVGTPPDVEYGMYLLERAVSLGSADAAKYLGDMYISEKHFPRDMERVLTYYKRAASLGRSGAYEMLGDIFYEGSLVKPNLAYAIELYELGAREGDAACRDKAHKLHGERENHFMSAKSFEKTNPELTFYHYAMSTAMGYIPSHKELARCFEEGIGTMVDRRAAFNWYRIAHQRGDFDAGAALGRCYARGIGTAYNFKLAVQILTPSATLGNAEAEAELVRLYENKKKNMTRSLYSKAMRLIYMHKPSEAAPLLSLAADLLHPDATYTLGALTEFGLGVAADRQLAESLYRRAMSYGFRDDRHAYKLQILKMSR